MIRVFFALPLCIALAACGTPQDRCARGLERDLRTVNLLIDETEANLARGYRYETEIRNSNVGVSFCNRSRNVGFCWDNYGPRTVQRPVAIDPAQEQRKLKGLKARQAEIAALSCLPNGTMKKR